MLSFKPSILEEKVNRFLFFGKARHKAHDYLREKLGYIGRVLAQDAISDAYGVLAMIPLAACCGGGGGGHNPTPIPTSYACSNGIDDDGDTLVDMADPGCGSATDNDESPFNDVIAPGKIDDLVATASAQAGEKAVIEYTQSGDDGYVGTPAQVIIRASKNPITSQTEWDNAYDVAVLTGIDVGGGGSVFSREFDLSQIPLLVQDGLNFGDLYFSVRVVDEAGNISPLSNSPDATVKSKAEFYVDAQLPTQVLYLHEEAWPLINGDPTNGISGRALELGSILATVTASPFDTPEAMRDYLFLVTDDVYAPTPPPGDFELCHVNSSLRFNDLIVGNNVRLDTRTPGNDNCNPGYPDDYNGLTDPQMQDFRNIVRDFLIEYVGAHPENYGNLDPTQDAGWGTY